MIIRKLGDKKPNVVLFQGSPRDKETCSGMDSKTEVVVNYLVEQWFPFINFKVIDLSVNQTVWYRLEMAHHWHGQNE